MTLGSPPPQTYYAQGQSTSTSPGYDPRPPQEPRTAPPRQLAMPQNYKKEKELKEMKGFIIGIVSLIIIPISALSLFFCRSLLFTIGMTAGIIAIIYGIQGLRNINGMFRDKMYKNYDIFSIVAGAACVLAHIGLFMLFLLMIKVAFGL
jgi:hypothetical protein